MITEVEINEIEQRIINQYYELGGAKLSQAEPLTVLFKTITYALARQQGLIKYLSTQNYVQYASGANLDELAKLVGVARLNATPAYCTIRFTRVEGTVNNILIPAGTRVTADSKVYFMAEDATSIPADLSYVDVQVVSIETGMNSNGYTVGAIKILVDLIPYVKSVSNVTASVGGNDVEADDELRQRVLVAPESLSIAGPRLAYVSITKNALPNVMDVYVTSSTPGVVEIYPLMKGGKLPTDDELSVILKKASADSVRPLTDKVLVLPPIEANYDINFKYYLGFSSQLKEAEVIKTTNAFIETIKQRIGRDIVFDELVSELLKIGVKRVDILGDRYIEVPSNAVAFVKNINITFGDYEDE